MNYTFTTAVAAVALAASVVSAHAGCAYPGKIEAGSFHAMPGFLTSHLAPPVSSTPRTSAIAAQNIVGTWLVTYTSGGQPFGQALIQWHDDFTEWENINLPIEGGNVCVGSWKPVDDSHVTRVHYGWLYTAGILSGYFIETETNRVRRNEYSGVNDTKIFDLNGNLLAEVPGTSSALRIAP